MYRFFLSLLAVCHITTAAILHVAIPPSQHLSNPATLPATTHATLRKLGTYVSAPLSRSNVMTFSGIEAGSYVLDVFCRDFAFASLRVDVEDLVKASGANAVPRQTIEVFQTYRGNEWDNRGPKMGNATTTVTMGEKGKPPVEEEAEVWVRLAPLGAKEFYQKRAGFSVMSIFKNPMMLMGMVSLALIVGLPKLLEGMDDETRQEFEEMSAKSPMAAARDPGAALGSFDFASWMAGRSEGGSSKKSSGGGGGGGNKGGSAASLR